ncbi:MAG: hypothetical protein Q9174_003696 [Haloplaca sp. 1 TL-2023]
MPHACHYDIHTKAAKELLMAEISRLRKENQQLQHRNSALGEKNKELAEKLQSSSSAKNSHSIVGLKQEDHHPSSLNLGNHGLNLDPRYKPSMSAMPPNPPPAAHPSNWALGQSPCNWKPSFHVIPSPTVLVQSRSFHVLVSGVFAAVFLWEGYSLYRAFSAPEVAPQDFDFSDRFDATARAFDDDVEFTEWSVGITKLRKRLVQQAHGNVLEAAVGTGRNSQFYDMKSGRIKSLTALDQSKEMIDVARAKWQASHPKDEPCRFMTSSALDPLPSVPNVNDKKESAVTFLLRTRALLRRRMRHKDLKKTRPLESFFWNMGARTTTW